MRDADRRAVLEEIAFGGDPKVLPADRLRALDALAELDGGDFAAEVERASEGALDELLDAATATTVELLLDDDRATAARYPATAAALHAAVERRASELSRSRRRPRRREPEPPPEPAEISQAEQRDEPVVEADERADALLPPGWQLERGWADDRSRRPFMRP